MKGSNLSVDRIIEGALGGHKPFSPAHTPMYLPTLHIPQTHPQIGVWSAENRSH